METTNTPDMETLADAPVKKKKGKLWFFLILLVLILAAGGGTGYYLHQRQLPAQAVEDYLKNVQNMDFEGMASHLQSSDLSALDNADIRNAAYDEFFRGINKKMTFRILKNQFDIQNGTAQITARIRHIDGSNIYKDAVNEFLRQIVSAALSGENVSDAQQETQAKLASILTEKAAAAEEVYTETDITYPLIRENKVWKIVALDEETVKIMSANFKNAAEEIQKTLEEEEPQEDKNVITDNGAPSDKDSDTSPVENTTLSLTTADFTLRYTGHKTSKDFAGKPCLLIYYDYTNTGSVPSSAMVDVNLKAYQEDESLIAAIPEKSDKATDSFFEEIAPGETVNVCQVFSLTGNSPVTLKAESALSEGSETSASQILNIK